MSRLDILVLHCMGPEKRWFAGVADVELIFPRYDITSNYLVHNCYLKIPNFVKEYPFDAIIMMSTFMDGVVRSDLYGDWINQFEFVRNSSAVKIVFPQDDYWFSELRDQFYIDYRIDKVYPVCAESTWEDLIPNYLKSGGCVQQGYTTYLTPKMLSQKQHQKNWTERSFDIVYRAKKVPTAHNRYGYIKGVIGKWFLDRLTRSDVKTNISTDPSSLIRGDQWIDFVSRSRAILGSNSGSSVNLRNHAVLERLIRYQAKNPKAMWDEIEEVVFDGRDRGKEYTAISPRNLEAAMVGTLQVLTHGSYSGLLKPNNDFLLLEEDCANADEIVDLLRNNEFCLEKVDNCFRAVTAETKLNSSVLIRDFLQFIRANSRKSLSGAQTFPAVSKRYEAQIKYRIYVKDRLIFLRNIVSACIPNPYKQILKNIIKAVFPQ